MATRQALATQLVVIACAVLVQAIAQVPQWVAVIRRSTSHPFASLVLPSQAPKLATHAYAQAPLQVPVVFGRVAQVAPSSTIVSQSSSMALHTSVVGPTEPVHVPHAPDMHV